jgi:hypothetical protein
MREKAKDVGGCEEATADHHCHVTPFSRRQGRFQKKPLGDEAATGRKSHEAHPRHGKSKHGDGQLLNRAAQIGKAVVAERLQDIAGGEKNGGLGTGMGQNEVEDRTPRRPLEAARQAQRKDQEEITDLGHRGVGDELLQPPGRKGLERTPEDRRRPEHSRQMRCGGADEGCEELEPQPEHDVERGLDHQGREQRADRRRGVGVRRRQPGMQRKECCLHQQPHAHQGQGGIAEGLGREAV